jgi:FdhE protein
MNFLATAKANYRARIERTELLAQRFPFAQQILTFYTQIAQFQNGLYEQLPKLLGRRSVPPADGNIRSQLNTPPLMAPFREFLSVVELQGPNPLSTRAQELKIRGEATWAELLTKFWSAGMLEWTEAEPLTQFLARAFLQPYAEFVASSLLPPILAMTRCRCPHCDSLPLLGVLRPEGDGGKRFLHCSFCSLEWEFRRILCAHCGEEDEKRLPVYIAEQFPHMRVECCETCKQFLRTVDLTKDGHAVPLVDDLAAIPLTLWAQENGYTRIQSNLLGT